MKYNFCEAEKLLLKIALLSLASEFKDESKFQEVAIAKNLDKIAEDMFNNEKANAIADYWETDKKAMFEQIITLLKALK